MSNPMYIILLIVVIGIYVMYKEIIKYNSVLSQYRDSFKLYHILNDNKSNMDNETIIKYKIDSYILLLIRYNVVLYGKLNTAPGPRVKFEINSNISVYDKNKISGLLLKLWEDINNYSNIGPENKNFVENYVKDIAKPASNTENT